VQEKLEKLSVGDALRAIRFAEVVVIVLDAQIPFEKQDLQIADLMVREGRAPVIAFNKWDMIEDRQEKLAELREKTDRLLPQVRGIRAVTDLRADRRRSRPPDGGDRQTHKVWNKRISTAKLNRWLDHTQGHHPPPAVAGRRLKLKYMTQIKMRPPAFVLSCSRPEADAGILSALSETRCARISTSRVPIRMSTAAARTQGRQAQTRFAGARCRANWRPRKRISADRCLNRPAPTRFQGRCRSRSFSGSLINAPSRLMLHSQGQFRVSVP
jgi:predicted GTPase